MNISIQTERLLLRSFKTSDAEEYFRITRDPLIQNFVPYCYEPTLEDTIETIDFYYKNGDCIHDFYLVIQEIPTEKIIGAIIATSTTNAELDMSVLIETSSRNKGYMTEALLAFKDHVPIGSKLVFVIDKQNDASFHTISKLPNIKEVPFDDEQNQKYNRFILSVWSHKTKALGRLPSAFCHFINNLI